MKVKCIFIILFCFFITYDLHPEIFWDGNFYEQALLSFKGNKNIRMTYMGLSILDLKLDTRPSELVRVKSELEYALAHQKDNPLLVSENLESLALNTLNASITPEDFKFTIGRFLPAWGKAKIFRPLDLFIPQTYFLNMLSFRGIDGISAKYYVSDLSSVELLAIPSMDVRHIMPSIDLSSNSSFSNAIDHTVVAANIEIHITPFDNNLILLHDASSGNNLFGFTFKGDAIIGLWSELFYSLGKNSEKNFRASVGADWSFAKYYFLAIEYFYDESGTSDHTKYSRLMASVPRMTFGRQYLMFDFNILNYTELNFGITYLGNLLDASFVLFPYFRYEMLANCFLGLSLYHFNGRAGREFSPDLLGNYILNTYLLVRF
ncbi:MAG: hypothetical protein JW827_03525 [Spirochaetes bacterium]|nr:hypothetical protein [Spirochaetota bacterium]